MTKKTTLPGSKEELKSVKKYFKDNKDAVKYDRRESGFQSSYVKDKDGKIVKLGNKSEGEHLLGSGMFGRVKKSESMINNNATATKVQKFKENMIDEFYPQAKKEAEINLDLGIATGPLIERPDKNGGIKVYQEMKKLGNSIKETAKDLNLEQKLDVSIDILIAIDNLHSGKSSKSSTKYAHGDLHLGNILFDSKGNVQLIDFGCTELFSHKVSLTDKEQILHALADHEEQLFKTDELAQLPESIKSLFDYSDKSLENNSLKFISAAMIAYKNNPMITKEEIGGLRNDEVKQTFLIERHKRDKSILQMDEPHANNLLNIFQLKLGKYQQYLQKEVTNDDNSDLQKSNYGKKLEIVSRVLNHIDSKDNNKVQLCLIQVERDLVANYSTFKQKEKVGEPVVSGLIKRIASHFGDDKISISSFEKEIDKQVGKEICSNYRVTMKQLRQREKESNLELELGSPPSMPTKTI